MCSCVAVGGGGIGGHPPLPCSFWALCADKEQSCNTVRAVERHYLQENQPPGVPALPLTGERTLPDVPEEAHGLRRRVVGYEWLAERVRGKRAVDMAGGEGYGSDVLARTPARVVGVD